jgi:hypothetical protein
MSAGSDDFVAPGGSMSIRASSPSAHSAVMASGDSSARAVTTIRAEPESANW